jgi:hypothetical protein
MKQITIPTDTHLLTLLEKTSKDIQDFGGSLSRYPKPYDTILVLKLMKKQIIKILKETNN